jgi:ComF family protein
MPSKRSQDLCLACEHELPYLTHGCKFCAVELPKVDDKICGKCLAEPPPFRATIGLWQYKSPVDYLIAGLKFHRNLLYAKLLGSMLLNRLRNIYMLVKPEVIIPIPLHNKRLQERGFNQSLELSLPIAKGLKIPVDIISSQRVKPTIAQSLIHADQRQANVKNAFKISRPMRYKYVAVLDDVITTGSTVREFSMALRNAGVEKIDIWCVAKT